MKMNRKPRRPYKYGQLFFGKIDQKGEFFGT